MKLNEQKQLTADLSKILEIFKHSGGAIRPHFMLTGPSGSGKSHLIATLADEHKLDYLEINAAQLTKEGTSGNSLSKALSPLTNSQQSLVICFVDEFDKLFISGNSNSSLAHETTNGVQNEFLKVLESDTASVFSDYGKYANISVKTVLFIFAGAFNGEEDINLDRLREFGVKTEFLGRVGLVFNTSPISLDSLYEILDSSETLKMYLELFPSVPKDEVTELIREFLCANYVNNTIGIRLINTLIHQYFIKGGELGSPKTTPLAFQTTLKLNQETNKQSVAAWNK